MKNQFLRSITTIYILLPAFLFIYGWLKTSFALIALVILASCTVTIFIDIFRSFSNRHVFYEMKTKSGIPLAFFMIVIWLGFSGAGGVGFQNDDYRASNALLNDLITQDWPLTTVLDNTQAPVVYYVAYYLPAAAIGKAFGWIYANMFLFLWTLMGVTLAFLWFGNISRIDLKNRAVKVVTLLTVIFCLGGGLDHIGTFVFGNFFSPTAHIEPWAGYFEYPSNTTLIYWVPQHTIASWLVIGMIVDALYNKHNLKYLGMVVAAGMLWSPFGIVGAAPYFLFVLFAYLQPQNRRYLCNWESIFINTLSIGMGIMYLLYLGSNQFRFPIGFIWQLSKKHADLAVHLLAFLCLEFALLGTLILLLIGLGTLSSCSMAFPRWDCRKRIALLEQEFHITPLQLSLFLASLVVLAVLPLFKMGIKNDLVMRGSITSLFIFWSFVAKLVSDVSVRVKTKFKLLYALISVLLTIGFFTSFNEITRSAISYHIGPPALSTRLTTANANENEIVLQRIGNGNSIFYRYFGK